MATRRNMSNQPYQKSAACLLVLAILCWPYVANASSIQAGRFNREEPVYIEADAMDYNENASIVTATGNVEAIQGDRVLKAQKITYDKKQNTVHAVGDVSLQEKDGNTYFADEVTLKDDLVAGTIKQFKARMSDDSRFAASEAERVDGNVTRLSKAVYSPCKICLDDPDSKPLWQIKADRVKINEEEQRISYRDVWFEVKGVPIAYTPYLSHPTPDADRKSGFLTPTYKTLQQLRVYARNPILRQHRAQHGRNHLAHLHHG